MQCDRTLVDFKNEIRSLYIHESDFTRPRLAYLINNIYIPKFKAKSFAAYLYGGETSETHSNYRVSINEPNLVFGNPDRSKDEVMLGIECSFDESAASLVNSFGEIKSNHQITQWDQWNEFNGIVPELANEKHKVNVPKVTEQALRDLDIKKGDPRLKGIAVSLGPGQEKSLNVGLKFAQELGKDLDVPVIPVNHLEGHIMTARFS